MPTDLAILQIVGGALLSGTAFLAVRSVIRSRDRSRTGALRDGSAPFIRSAEQWHDEAEQRARLALDGLVRLEKSLPPVGPPTARNNTLQSDPMTSGPIRPYSQDIPTSPPEVGPEEVARPADDGIPDRSGASPEPEQAIPVQTAPAASEGRPAVHLPDVTVTSPHEGVRADF
ncbi:MAG: hypothetical protein DI532_23315 [Azospirillum brasilense]|nr:MAG: hypothetical protein DI532_23315 [Azospirillum brasilense]